jgi:hypothetical protein
MNLRLLCSGIPSSITPGLSSIDDLFDVHYAELYRAASISRRRKYPLVGTTPDKGQPVAQ